MAEHNELPKNWTKCFSKTRKLDYYFNTKTLESVWTIEEVFKVESQTKSYDEAPKNDNSNTKANLLSIKNKSLTDERNVKLKKSAGRNCKNIPESSKLTPNELRDSLKNKIEKKNELKASKKTKIIAKEIRNNNEDKIQLRSHKFISTNNNNIKRYSPNKNKTSTIKNNDRTTLSPKYEINKMDVIELNIPDTNSTNTLNYLNNKDVNNKNSNLFDLELMEIEIIDNINEIRKENLLNKSRNELERPNDDTIVSKLLTNNFENSNTYKINNNKLYIVLDTNVLISHLSQIKETLNKISGKEKFSLIIVIPWVIIKELDILKSRMSNTVLANQARLVNNFLFDKLNEKSDSFYFQTSLENDEIIKEIKCCTNDDYILKCALKIKISNSSSKVILLTNDKNLQTKAIISNIDVYSYDKFMKELSVIENSMISTHEKNKSTILYEASSSNTRTNENHLTPNSLFNKLFDFMQSELISTYIRIFSYIYKTEMIKAYNELWIDVVLIRPPWDLKSLNANLNKHYSVLFGFTTKHESKQYWQSISDSINIYYQDLPKTDQSLNKCDKLKLFVKMSADTISFINLIDHNSYKSQIFWSLVKYLQKLSSYSLKIYKTFEFCLFNSQINNLKSSTNMNVNELLNCFQVFEPIWFKFYEFCSKISDNGIPNDIVDIQNYIEREICFYMQLYALLLNDLKSHYESCLCYSNEENLLNLTKIIFVLYYLLDIKVIDSGNLIDTQFIYEYTSIKNAISKCFLSLNHSETMRNGLNQLNGFNAILFDFEDKQRLLISKLIQLDIQFLNS